MNVFALTSTVPGRTIDMLEDMDVSHKDMCSRLLDRLHQAKIDGWSDIQEYRYVTKSSDTSKYHQWKVLALFKWSEKLKQFVRKESNG